MNRRETPQFQEPNLMISHRNNEVVACKKCGCSWMEQLLVQQYNIHHNVILGQKVPAHNEIGFWLLRCVKCFEVYEPNVQIGVRDSMRQEYDKFLDHMEKPIDVPDGEKV